MQRAWPLLLNLPYQPIDLSRELRSAKMRAIGVLARQAVEWDQILDEAANLIVSRLVNQELLVGVQLVPDT